MFEHQKILILGFARSGYEVAKLLRKRDNQVIINDGKPEEKHDSAKIQELKDLGVEFVFGSHPDNLLDNSFQYLIKNPGVPIDHSYVVKAKDLGIEVMNETELAYRLLPKDKNIKLIGITGTNGKTTTTTLIYNFIKEDGKRVHLAGNIGYPLCSFLDKLEENDIIVDGVDNIKVSVAKCCNPVPGDEIIGYITKGEGIIVHKKSCPNIKNIDTRLIDVDWNSSNSDKLFIARIRVMTDTTNNHILDIVTKASTRGITISSINEINDKYGLAYEITVKVKNKDDLLLLVDDLRILPFVKEVIR